MLWITIGALLLAAFITPIVLPWRRWLGLVTAGVAVIALVLRACIIYEMSSPDYRESVGDFMGPAFLSLLWALFLAGLGMRMLAVLALSFTRESRYGDLKAAIAWWRAGRVVPFRSKLAVSLVIASLAMAVLVSEFIPYQGRYPFSLLDFLPWQPRDSGLLIAVALGFPVGILFWESPLRWAIACSGPAVATVLLLSWVARFDAAGLTWGTYWIAMGKFLMLFALLAFVAARAKCLTTKFLE